MATYIKIASNTVGSGGVASVTFSSIPATYTDLVIKASTRSTGAFADFKMQFNGDTGSNYPWRSVRGNGASIDNSTNTTTSLVIGESSSTGTTANTFGNQEIYIPNYRSAAYKSGSVDSVSENNATTAYATFTAQLWNSTSAIISITLFSGTGNVAEYSTFTLYGISNA
jgi:hypothetical protein